MYKNICLLAGIPIICDEVRERKNPAVFLIILFVCFVLWFCFLIDKKNVTHWPTVKKNQTKPKTPKTHSLTS